MSKLDQEAAYVFRDLMALPERERVLVLQQVERDLAAGEMPIGLQEANEEMANSIEIFNQVADHLGFDSDLAKLTMKMREFDAAPYRIREGVRARQIARVFKSWSYAKRAAIGEKLPLTPAQRRLRGQIYKERRSYRRIEQALYEWLSTKPEKTTSKAYDKWRTARNESLAENEPRFPGQASIAAKWKRSWPELVAEAKAGNLKPPTVSVADPLAVERRAESIQSGRPEFAPQAAEPGALRFDADLIARRLREAREARGLSRSQLSRRSGVPLRTIHPLEDSPGGHVRFQTLVKLARALDIPLDFLASPDGKTGLPPRARSRQG